MSALAMGIQTATAVALGVHAVFTTAATATWTVLAADAAHSSETRIERRRLAMVLAGTLVGALARRVAACTRAVVDAVAAGAAHGGRRRPRATPGRACTARNADRGVVRAAPVDPRVRTYGPKTQGRCRVGVQSPPAPVRPLAAFAVPNYRRFVIGQSVSLVGSWTETVAQALLVLALTHRGLWQGLATAARYLPVLLLTPYAGLIVDRADKRTVLLLAQASLAAVSLVLGGLVLLGAIELWMVFAAALVFGKCSPRLITRHAWLSSQRSSARRLIPNAVTIKQHVRQRRPRRRPGGGSLVGGGSRHRLVLRRQRHQLHRRVGRSSHARHLPADQRRSRRAPRSPAARRPDLRAPGPRDSGPALHDDADRDVHLRVRGQSPAVCPRTTRRRCHHLQLADGAHSASAPCSEGSMPRATPRPPYSAMVPAAVLYMVAATFATACTGSVAAAPAPAASGRVRQHHLPDHRPTARSSSSPGRSTGAGSRRYGRRRLSAARRSEQRSPGAIGATSPRLALTVGGAACGAAAITGIVILARSRTWWSASQPIA